MFLIVIGAGIVIVWAYVLFVREWLDAKLQGTRYAWWHEQIEDKLWQRSRTLLVSYGYILAGSVVFLQGLAVSAGIDVTPFVNELAKLIPEQYRGLAIGVITILTGVGFAYLRQVTTTPVGEEKQG